MRSDSGNTVVSLLLVVGLAFGSAAHRFQHGLDNARSVPAVHEASAAHPGEATVGDPARATVVDEATCVLCQEVNAHVLLELAGRDGLEPGRVTAARAASVVRAALEALNTGRSPPGRI